MNKYLTKIKRPNSAPRPPEVDLEWENKIDLGELGMQPKFVTQDPTVDTYIQARSNSSVGEIIPELEAMEETSPLKRNKQTDDIELWPYPENGHLIIDERRTRDVAEYIDIDETVIPAHTEYSELKLQVFSENNGGEHIVESIEEAQTIINGLDPDDGYALIDNTSWDNRTAYIKGYNRPNIKITEMNKPTRERRHSANHLFN